MSHCRYENFCYIVDVLKKVKIVQQCPESCIAYWWYRVVACVAVSSRILSSSLTVEVVMVVAVSLEVAMVAYCSQSSCLCGHLPIRFSVCAARLHVMALCMCVLAV